MKYSKYLKTSKWSRFREMVLAQRGFCEGCGTTERLELHHLTYERLGNEAPEDVQVLCHDCHQETEGFPAEDLKQIEKELGINEPPY